MLQSVSQLPVRIQITPFPSPKRIHAASCASKNLPRRACVDCGSSKSFLDSAVQGEHDKAAAKYREKHSQINEVLVLDEPVTGVLDELQLDDSDLTEAVRMFLNATQTRREKVNDALTKDLPPPQNLPTRSLDVHILTSYVEKPSRDCPPSSCHGLL